MDVDGAGVGGERVAPDPFQDLVAGEDQALVADQVAEQLELTGGELHRAALEDDLVAGRVDGEAAQVSGARDRIRVGVGAAQDRLDPGDQLAGRERLGHVVVGAELEAEDLVGLLLLAVTTMIGTLPPAMQRPGHLEPVHARQHQVEQDQPGRSASTAASPEGPSVRHTTRKPSRSRYSRTRSAMDASSSTSSTVPWKGARASTSPPSPSGRR